jgi:hypothetical protein
MILDFTISAIVGYDAAPQSYKTTRQGFSSIDKGGSNTRRSSSLYRTLAPSGFSSSSDNCDGGRNLAHIKNSESTGGPETIAEPLHGRLELPGGYMQAKCDM